MAPESLVRTRIVCFICLKSSRLTSSTLSRSKDSAKGPGAGEASATEELPKKSGGISDGSPRVEHDLYQTFLSFVSRYLKLPTATDRFCVGVNERKRETGDTVQAFCDDCQLLICNICELYAKLNAIKLQLLFKMGTLEESIRQADRSVSKKLVHGLIRSLVKQLNVGSPMQVNSLRRQIAFTCKHKRKGSAPKVVVLRGLFPDEWKFTYSATRRALMTLIITFGLLLSPPKQANDKHNSLEDVQKGRRRSRKPLLGGRSSHSHSLKETGNVFVKEPMKTEEGSEENFGEDADFVDEHETFRKDSDSDWSGGGGPPSPGSAGPSSDEELSKSSALAPKKRWNFRKRNRRCNGARDENEAEETENETKYVPRRRKIRSSNNVSKVSIPCHKCGSRFLNRERLRKHLLNVHGEQMILVCSFCGMLFKQNSELVQHKRTLHSAEVKSRNGRSSVRKETEGTRTRRRFLCNQCNNTFTTLRKLNRHQHVLHGVPMEFPCSHCDQIFKAYKELVRHKIKVHRSVDRRRVESKCIECDEVFPSRTAMFLHVKQTHKMRYTKHECPICFRTVISKQRLHRHIEAHESNTLRSVKIFYCECCGKHFYKESSLSDHMLKVHDGSYCCFLCGVKYPIPKLLRKHLETHETEDKSFYCDYCFRGFTSQQYHDIHRKMAHLDKRKFFCDSEQCFEDYDSIEALNEHLQSHIATDTLQDGSSESKVILNCSTCNCGFLNKFNLKLHELMHIPHSKSGTGYDCPECGKNVRYKETLLAHYNRHHHGDCVMRLTCEKCGRSFTSHHWLKQHMRSHRLTRNTGGLPYVCDICGLDWGDLRSLAAHKRGHEHEETLSGVPRPRASHKRIVNTDEKRADYLDPASPPPFPQVKVKRKVGRPRKKPLLDEQAQENPESSATNTPAVPCELCDETFKSAYLLRKHMEKDHETNDNSIQCCFCDRKFTFSQTHTLHVQAVHKGKKFECDGKKCDDTFNTHTELNEHLQKHLTMDDAKPPGGHVSGGVVTVAFDETITPTYSQIHYCQVCNWGFLDTRLLKLHQLCHLAKTDKGFECPEPGCSDHFMTNSWLVQHYNRAHGVNFKPYKCLECETAFYSRPSLQAHITRHDIRRKNSSKDAFVCVDCGNHFKDAQCLEKHRRRHNPDWHLPCTECGGKFASSKLLSIHLRRVHNKGEKYPCPICGMTFIFQHYVNRHMEVHSEKQIECDICHRKFQRERTMRDHRKTHEPNREADFVCPQCGNFYKCKEGLEYHIRSKHTPQSEWPYSCQLCSRRFTRGMLLKAHLKSCSKNQGLKDARDIDELIAGKPVIRQQKTKRRKGREESDTSTSEESEDEAQDDVRVDSDNHAGQEELKPTTTSSGSVINSILANLSGIPVATPPKWGTINTGSVSTNNTPSPRETTSSQHTSPPPPSSLATVSTTFQSPLPLIANRQEDEQSLRGNLPQHYNYEQWLNATSAAHPGVPGHVPLQSPFGPSFQHYHPL